VVAKAHIVVVQDVAVALELPFLYAFPKSEYTRLGHSLEPKADCRDSQKRSAISFVGKTPACRVLSLRETPEIHE
jgi:hypothetical protein